MLVCITANTQIRAYTDNYKLLIIADAQLVPFDNDDISRFRVWKSCKGFGSKLVSATGGYVGALSVKDYIRQEYENGIEYVLLMGETSAIPVYRKQINDTISATGDYWYGCMDDDDYAEIAIGRFCTSDRTSFQNMIGKTIAYESAPNRFYDKCLLVAHSEDAPGKYQGCCEEIIGASYSTPMTFYKAYGASASHGGTHATNADVIDHIQSGLNIVNYRGHAIRTAWGGGDGWNTTDEQGFHFPYYDSQVDSLFTHRPIFLSIACLSGDITKWCMLKAFMNSIKGPVAFLGSTIESNTDANNTLDKLLFQKLLNEGKHHIGQMNLEAQKQTIADAPTTAEAIRATENVYAYILGGDPTLEIWTGEAQTFSDSLVFVFEDSYYYGSETEYGYKVYVTSLDGNLLQEYSPGAYNTLNIDAPCYVSVCRHNYVPKVFYCDPASLSVKTCTVEGGFIHINDPARIGQHTTATQAARCPWFDLQGRRISGEPQQRGVYISNGRKIMK